MSIFDVQYQPRAHRIIQRALASHRMPHAYLFGGPEGVGKEMLATALAGTLLCARPVRVPLPPEVAGEGDGPGLDACGACQDCLLVHGGTHPDLFYVYRQLNRQHPDADVRKRLATVLSVDVIRHFLIAQAGHRPNRGRAKVFIVREAERMNDQAQNALLKTLEEPPPDTFILLLTSALDLMLPTTRSRCQPVPFGALPPEFVVQRLKALRPETPEAEATYAARHAGGSLGLALRHLDDGLFAIKQTWGDRLLELAAARPGFAAHALAGPFEADAKALARLVADRDPDVSDSDATRAGVKTLFAMLAGFYTDALRRAEGASVALANEDQAAVIGQLAGLGTARLTAGLRELSAADANIGRNANVSLALESLFIRLARR